MRECTAEPTTSQISSSERVPGHDGDAVGVAYVCRVELVDQAVAGELGDGGPVGAALPDVPCRDADQPDQELDLVAVSDEGDRDFAAC